MIHDMVVTSATTLSNSFLGDTNQVCVVTPDIQRTMAGFVKLGVGPWRVFTFGPHNTTEQTYRGKSQPHSMLLAVGRSGTSKWEIIQPLEGESVYRDWLDRRGESVHHVVQLCGSMDYEAKIAEFARRGLAVAQSGNWSNAVRYAYFDAEHLIGTYIEISSRNEAVKFPEPENWYPAAPPATGA